MVKSANMNGLLDSDSDSLTDCQQRVKARLHEIMQKNRDFNEDDYQKVTQVRIFQKQLIMTASLTSSSSRVIKLAPTSSPSLVNSIGVIGNPVRTFDQVHTLIQSLTSQICKRLEDPKSASWCPSFYLR